LLNDDIPIPIFFLSDTENAAEIRLNTNVLTELQVLELIASLEGKYVRDMSNDRLLNILYVPCSDPPLVPSHWRLECAARRHRKAISFI
jgi:hypothetical protein